MKPKYTVLRKIQMSLWGLQGQTWEDTIPTIWTYDMTDFGGVGCTADYQLYLNLVAVRIGKPKGRQYKNRQLIVSIPVSRAKSYPVWEKDVKKKGGEK